MLTTRFNFNAKVALVYNNQHSQNAVLELWTEPTHGPQGKAKKMFTDKKGRKVILENQGDTFFGKAKQTNHCSYHAEWFGEFPYGSWAWGIQYIKAENRFRVVELETEINSRGLNETEAWEYSCAEYKPVSAN